MAENTRPGDPSPTKIDLAKVTRASSRGARTPMASDTFYNTADATAVRTQLISPPPEETLHLRRVSVRMAVYSTCISQLLIHRTAIHAIDTQRPYLQLETQTKRATARPRDAPRDHTQSQTAQAFKEAQTVLVRVFLCRRLAHTACHLHSHQVAPLRQRSQVPPRRKAPG